MKKKLMAGVFACLVPCALAAPIQWEESDGGNGHWYEAVCVPQSISWSDAKLAAEQAGGYLATIQSAGESEFVWSLVEQRSELWHDDSYGNGIGPWLGGMETSPGVWEWVTGEAWTYSNWAPGEPNDFNTEWCLHLFSPGGYAASVNNWNDMADSPWTEGYVIEYNTPEPATFGLMMIAACLAVRRR